MSDYPTEMEIKILTKVSYDPNNYTRRTLGLEVKREYGSRGFSHLQLFWKNGFIRLCRFSGLTLTKKGFKYWNNMKEELKKEKAKAEIQTN